MFTAACTRYLPRQQGYRTLSASPPNGSNNREDENRLIDELDENWED